MTSSTNFARHRFLALAAWFLAAAPLAAQTSDILNYVDHINVDFAHKTVVPTNTALSYRDRYGDLQGPPAGARNESNVFYLYSTTDLHRLDYATSESPTWRPAVDLVGVLSLTSGSDVSYTPIQTGRPPPTMGPYTIYSQFATATGARNAIDAFDLVFLTRDYRRTMYTDPPLSPYSPGTALLATSDTTAILTTGDGTVSTVHHGLPLPNVAVTPLISAQGSAPGELNNPSALAIGPDGLLYVLDAGNNRIQKYTVATGEYRGGFSLPAGMTVFTTAASFDGNGNLVYHGDGTDVLSNSMAISTEGRIYLGDGLGGGFVFSLDGNLLANFHPPEPDGSWVNGPLVPNTATSGQVVGAGSYLNYDGLGNVFTYVEGKGLFRYRDPSYDELDFVNLTVGGNQPTTVTSGPGLSVLGSLSFRNDLAATFGTLIIVDPVTVRTGNIYVQRDEWSRDSTGVIEGGTLLTEGDMHKINDGTLILNNVNTYTGKTIVDDGTLIVNGSIAGDAVVTDDATLGGHGVIGGAVTVEDGGFLSPGNSPGLLTINGDLTLSDLSTLNIELGGTGTGLFDQLYVGGLFTADGILNLQILDGYTPGVGESFLIFPNGGFDLGDFNSLTTNLGDGLTWDTSKLGSTGVVTTVPEPTTSTMIFGALIGLLILRRRNVLLIPISIK